LDQDRLRCARALWVILNLLQKDGVGLKIKMNKSNFRPMRTFTFLGLMFDTAQMRVTAPLKRLIACHDTAKRLVMTALKTPGKGHTTYPVKTRDLARFVGQAVSLQRAIRPAKRRLLFIQQSMAHGIKRGGWNGLTFLSYDALQAMRWWTSKRNLDEHNGDDIRPLPRPIHVTIAADAKASDARDVASYGGWIQVGNVHLTTRGFFTAKEALKHVNWLELKAQFLTRQALLPLVVPQHQWNLVHIHHLSDNTAAVKYGNVPVSRSLLLSRLGAEIFDDEEAHKLTSSHSHIAGVLQVEADFQSRVKSTHKDWMLNRGMFRQASSILLGRRKVNVDLFADRQNHQVPTYYSYQHDHDALGTDALCHPWAHLGVVYAYPPLILLGRILGKIMQEKVQHALIVAPMWEAQTWFPTLVEMAVDAPLLLPQQQWITVTPLGHHSWKCRWTLAVWHISGVKSSTSGTVPMTWTASSKARQSTEIKSRMTRLSGYFWNGQTHEPTSHLTPSIREKFAPRS